MRRKFGHRVRRRKWGARGYQSAMFLAERLKTRHINVLVEEMDFCRVIGNVVCLLGTADVGSVRDSCVHYTGASMLRLNLDDGPTAVFLGTGGNEIFVDLVEEEEEPERVFWSSQKHNGVCEPAKTTVAKMDRIYRDAFGFEPRFPFFTPKLVEFAKKCEFMREEMVEWLCELVPATYSEYSIKRAPVVSALSIGVQFDTTVRAFARMDEQTYYNTILTGPDKFNR